MNIWTRFFIAVACASASLQATSLPVWAGQARNATFSKTPQSDVVAKLIGYMRDGKFKEFRGLLESEALSAYGTESGMRALRERFEKVAAGAGTSEINIRTYLNAILKPDTLLFSNHAYSTEVLGRDATGSPIWNVSVNCMNMILFEALGTQDGHCRIGKISPTEHHSAEQLEGASITQAQALRADKELGEDTVGANSAGGSKSAGSATAGR